MQNGCPPHKLAIGLATYGRGFTLSNPLETGYGAITYSPSQDGKWTGERGFMAYYEVKNIQYIQGSV